MSIRAKLLVLLGAVVALFAGGLFLLQLFSRRQFEAVTAARAKERGDQLDHFLEDWSRPIETFVADSTCWDELVAAMANQQPGWSEQAFDDNKLNSYRVHVLWIYRPDGTLFAARNHLYSPAVNELPVPIATAGQDLQTRKLNHFFARTPLGFLEIRGATIHPSRDSARATPSQGCLFAAHLWVQEDLKEMSFLTGNEMSIQLAGAAPPPRRDEKSEGVVTITRPLLGLDGQPIATLVARNVSPVVREFHALSERLFLWLAIFAFFVYLLLIVALRKWVIRPFQTISRSLRTENPALLDPWLHDRGDYGKLGRVIRTFFEQRQALVEEMRERRAAEKTLETRDEELRHALKLEAIGRLAGGVAHDFNNLLTVIIGYASMVPPPADGSGQHACGEIILKAAQKAAGLTQQLLAFSRKQVLHPRVLDLNALVREMEKLLQRTLGEQIELCVETTSALGRVRADPTQLEQVIVNLAINARDAMPRGGVLTIRTEDFTVTEAAPSNGSAPATGAFVVLSVEDTGTGMSPETEARIFEPFFTTKNAGHGTGLGLATVYGIVRQSGGVITVDSREGVGTTFRVRLPLETADIDPPPIALPALPNSTRHERILVVDDDKAVRELMCRVLQNYDLRVECAANCPEALSIGGDLSRPLHLLITDIVMPILTGPELALRIRENRPGLPVLLVSGYAHEAMTGLETLQPQVEMLDKPFTPQELARQVFALLAEARAAQREAPLRKEVDPAGLSQASCER